MRFSRSLGAIVAILYPFRLSPLAQDPFDWFDFDSRSVQGLDEFRCVAEVFPNQ